MTEADAGSGLKPLVPAVPNVPDVPVVPSLTAVQSSRVQSDLEAGSNGSSGFKRSTASLNS
jgi:hypothetical protein